MGQAKQNRILREQRLANTEARVNVLLKLSTEQIKSLQVTTAPKELKIGDHRVQLGRYRKVWVLEKIHHFEEGIMVECDAYRHDGKPDTAGLT
jgi:hypothetical protein